MPLHNGKSAVVQGFLLFLTLGSIHYLLFTNLQKVKILIQNLNIIPVRCKMILQRSLWYVKISDPIYSKSLRDSFCFYKKESI
jgi:hypothetical protein